MAVAPETAAVVPADICDRTTPALGSCDSGDVCQDSSDASGWSVIKAGCILPGNDLREGLPCSTLRLSGRCYRDNGGFPLVTYTYGGHSNRGSAEKECQETDARFCPNLPGVTDQDYQSCMTVCAAKKPDLSRAPECELDVDCPDDCVRAGIGVSPACADCIHQALGWGPSYCGQSECTCIPPHFPTPTDPICKALFALSRRAEGELQEAGGGRREVIHSLPGFPTSCDPSRHGARNSSAHATTLTSAAAAQTMHDDALRVARGKRTSWMRSDSTSTNSTPSTA